MIKSPVKPLHSIKASNPIEVTEFGIDKLPLKPLQLEKAPEPIEVTEFDKIK